MELLDYVYMKIIQNFNDYAEIYYTQEHKVANPKRKPIISIYQIGKASRLADINSNLYISRESVGIKIMTMTKNEYAYIESKMKHIFNGQSYNYNSNDEYKIIDTFTLIEKSAYIDVLGGVDITLYSVGDYVKYGDKEGIIFFIDDNIYVYTFKNEIMLIKVDGMSDLSKYMTNVYAFDITISSEVFEW